MACTVCSNFLDDFLRAGIPKELEITKKIRLQSYLRTVPEFGQWIHRVYNRLCWKDFERSYALACRISRRDRKLVEYEYLLYTSTWNLLKHDVPWLEQEIKYMKLLLVEAGVSKGKHVFLVMSIAQELVSHIAPRALFYLHTVHTDHLYPKGLMTDLGFTHKKVYEPPQTQIQTQTFLDTDDLYT
jgi:hypothetical protein